MASFSSSRSLNELLTVSASMGILVGTVNCSSGLPCRLPSTETQCRYLSGAVNGFRWRTLSRTIFLPWIIAG